MPTYAQSEEDDLAKLLDQLAGTENTWDSANTENTDTNTGDVNNEHNAANDILDNMNDKWSYSTSESIAVEDITTDSAVIKTTEVLYENTPVTKYKIYVSDKSLLDVEDYSTIEDRVLIPIKTENKMVYLKLSNLDPETKYYVIVAPVHPTDPNIEAIDMISDEVSFTTQKAKPTPNTKMFTKVSYTYKDGKVTLTRDPSDLAKKAQISIRYKNDNNTPYVEVGKPDFNKGIYSFTVDKAWSYFLKMVALDGEGNTIWQEHIQTVKVDSVTKPPVEEVVKNAPKVWPASNALIGLMIFAIIVYLIYRMRSIKTKH